MKKLLPIIVLLLLPGRLFAQQQLLQLLSKSQADTTHVRIFKELGELYQKRRHSKNPEDLDTAKAYFLKALALSQLEPDIPKYSKNQLLMNLGEIAIDQNNIPEGRAYFMQSINYFHAKHDAENEAGAWERLGDYLNFPTKADLHVVDYYAKAIDIYDKLNNKNKVIRLGFRTALNKRYMNKTYEAEKICLQLIAKYKNTKFHNLELAYHLMSLINRYNGNLNKALYYAISGVRRMDLVKDTANAGRIYGELAQVYQASGDINNSIFYYKKTIVIRERMNILQQFIFRTAGFVIQMLITQKKAEEGLSYITDLEKRHPPDSEYEAGMIAQAKAYCYDALGLTEMAEKNYQIMMRGLGDDSTDLGAIAHLDITKFYVKHKKLKQAAYYLQNLIPIDAFMSKDIELMRFKIDSSEGKLTSAIDHFQRYTVINDSIFNISKTKQIQQLQVEYETEKKDKDIKLLKSDSLVQQARVQHANNMRNITLAGIFLLVLFLALLYNGYRFKQRKNDSLNQLVLEKDELLTEKESLLVEKQWLLKEIHHRVKNNLAIVMGLLNRQSAYIDNEAALAAIQNSQNRMRSIALIHQKLYQSENLDLIMMPEYIDELVKHLKDSFDLGTRIIFEKQIDELALDVSQAVPLGLIINEAITNSIKYAYPDQAAGLIRILLVRFNEHQNILQIKDNGPGLKKGFDPNKIDSLGMNLMKGLSKQLGGTFEMTEDEGVQISIIFKTEVFVATSAILS